MIPQTSPGGIKYLACADYDIGYINGLLQKNLLGTIGTILLFLFLSVPVVLLYLKLYRENIEAQLESEKKFAEVFRLNPNAFSLSSLSDGAMLEINSGFTNLFGFTTQDVKGKTTLELNIWAAESERKRVVEKLVANGKLEKEETQYRTKDGEIIDAQVSSVIIEVEKEQVICAEVMDITARKQAEMALRESEEKHRKLVSNISDVIVILDQKGFITYKSSNVTEQFGWNPDELIGKHGLFTAHIDDKERIGNELTQLLQRDNAKVRVVYNYLCKDGSFKPVELTAVNRVNDPVINGVLANYKDITERKQSEKRLKQSEEKYRTMIERSNDMIWTIDTSGNITFFNKQTEDVTGLKIKEWIGKSFIPLIIEEDLPMIMDIFQEGLKGKAYQYEFRFRKQENEILTISVNTAPLLKDGTVTGLVSFGRNITEQKLAEKEKANLESQLRQSQKMESIGTLAGGIAHDFNNILSGIFGNAQLLQLKMQKDSDNLRYLDSILKAGIRAKDLVTQILTFSRRSVNELNPVEIQLVVKEALKLIESSVPSTISIYQRIQNNCGPVLADHTQVHQIIMNLCTNAYHAMEETGGDLSINLKEVELVDKDLKDLTMNPGKYVELTVADTGTGIDSGILDRIFEPYFTTKEEGKGTGMGLAVIHGVVKSHGGHITVDSEPGIGTEFRIHLPVMEDRQEAVNSAVRIPIRKGDERILLVDDQKDVIDIEQQMLEVLGYKVTIKISSIDALDTFRSSPESFDLVITDMTMPNITGDRLAGELIKIRSDIPVIFCTGFSEKMSEKEATSLGIKGFIMKPVVLGDLSVMIRKVLDDK